MQKKLIEDTWTVSQGLIKMRPNKSSSWHVDKDAIGFLRCQQFVCTEQQKIPTICLYWTTKYFNNLSVLNNKRFQQFVCTEQQKIPTICLYWTTKDSNNLSVLNNKIFQQFVCTEQQKKREYFVNIPFCLDTVNSPNVCQRTATQL